MTNNYILNIFSRLGYRRVFGVFLDILMFLVTQTSFYVIKCIFSYEIIEKSMPFCGTSIIMAIRNRLDTHKNGKNKNI